jgi:hypothetical protein
MKKLLICFIFLLSSCNFLNNPFSTLDKLIAEKSLQTSYIIQNEIPIYGGLEVVESGEADFDTHMGGLFVMIYRIKDKNNLEQIKNLYYKSIPKFGWKLIEDKSSKDRYSYARDDDSLEIKFKENLEDKSHIHFLLIKGR